MADNRARGDVARLTGLVRDVPDFPVPGVLFKDITPILSDPSAMSDAVSAMSEPWRRSEVDLVVGIEARGFILGAPVAQALGVGFIPVRKPGKLPGDILSESYGLEYGQDSVEIHSDALPAHSRVVIIDDVLATGGTAAATARLVKASGAELVGFGFLIDLVFLNGRSRLGGATVHAVMSFGEGQGAD